MTGFVVVVAAVAVKALCERRVHLSKGIAGLGGNRIVARQEGPKTRKKAVAGHGFVLVQ
jgi:hypothetical protein